MSALKKLMKNYLAMSGFCIVLGLALVIKPGLLTKTLGFAVGGLLVGYGLVRLVITLRDRSDAAYLTMGVISSAVMIASGGFIMARPDFIPKVIALIFGVYMLVSGALNLRAALDMRRSSRNWVPSAVVSGLVLLGGLALLGNPLMLADTATRVLGVCLIVSGVLNIVGSARGVSALRTVDRADKDKFIDI